MLGSGWAVRRRQPCVTIHLRRASSEQGCEKSSRRTRESLTSHVAEGVPVPFFGLCLHDNVFRSVVRFYLVLSCWNECCLTCRIAVPVKVAYRAATLIAFVLSYGSSRQVFDSTQLWHLPSCTVVYWTRVAFATIFDGLKGNLKFFFPAFWDYFVLNVWTKPESRRGISFLIHPMKTENLGQQLERGAIPKLIVLERPTMSNDITRALYGAPLLLLWCGCSPWRQNIQSSDLLGDNQHVILYPMWYLHLFVNTENTTVTSRAASWRALEGGIFGDFCKY